MRGNRVYIRPWGNSMSSRIVYFLKIIVLVSLVANLILPTNISFAGSYVGAKWEKDPLVIKFDLSKVTATKDLSKDEWLNEIRGAFNIWNNGASENNVPLELVEDSNSPDVKVVIAGNNFRDISKAYYWQCLDPLCFLHDPLLTQIDRAEIVVYQSKKGVALSYKPHLTPESTQNLDPQSIVLHEIGHVLGLDHSTDCSAVMFGDECVDTVYKGYYGNFVKRNLSLDDISTLQGVYGTSGNLPPIQIPKTNSKFDNTTLIFEDIPPETVVLPNQNITKTWRMRNTGTTTWSSGYQLAFIRGDQMGAPVAVDVPSTTPGQEVDISVNLIAPTSTGSFTGYWRMRNPQGTYFGPEIWVRVNVQSSSGHITLLETDPPSPATTNMVRIHARVEEFPNLRAMRVKVDGEIKGEIGGPEIFIDWSTGGYQNGAHNIVVEAANWADLNWSNPEVKGTVFVLEGNTVSTNHAPNPPILINPGDWAVYEGTGEISLSAQENGDPDGDDITQYYFEIFDSHDIPNSGWINSNSWSPVGLSMYGYQWHVKVRDSHGAESGWSETRHFTVNDPNPQIYSFSSQVCRPSWNQGDPDKICFCAETNAGTLQLQINSATDGSADGDWKIINELGTSNYSCNLDSDSPPTLDPKGFETGTHRVRLYARKEGGWAAAKTQDISIQVGNLRPNPPEAQVLTNGAYANSQDVTLIWKPTLRTTTYRVEVSSEESFATHLVDQTLPSTQTEYSLHLNSPYGNVYWKVTASGPYGTNTATNLFHVDVTPPDSSLSISTNTAYENNFPVNWGGNDTGVGLQWYHIQVLDQSRPGSAWKDWLINTTQTAAIFQGQTGHDYLFRLRAMDQVGNWQAWPVEKGSRQVSVKIDPDSAPPTLWWNNGYAYKRNLTILNNDGDWMPSHYPIRIHLNSSTSPTAEEIYNASTSSKKGDDVRIVYNNNTELDRFVRRFTSSQIDIWFPLQAGLGGGATDSNSYQVYYGNSSAGTPPANINSVFLPMTDDNTMGLWHFQETAGNTLYDSSGRSHNGYFYNSGWADGLFSGAGYFNGSNAYVEVQNTGDLNPGSITLEAWIYLNGYLGDHPMIISKDYYWFKVDNDRKLWFCINANGGNRIVVSNTALNMNQWYHVAATYNGNGTMKIFINGNENGSRSESPLSILYTSLPFRIGRASHSDPNVKAYFPGLIQNVRVSNIARTDFSYARIDIQPTVAVGVQQTPPIQGSPDLLLLGMSTYPHSSGGVLVEAVVKNQGTLSTVNGFYTDLYFDHLPTGAGDYTGSLSFWINDPIAAGSVVTLTTVIPQLPGTTSLALAPASETKALLYAQIDSTGAVTEEDDSNNIFFDGLEICTATQDALEGDDTATAASSAVVGQSQLHNFTTQSDQDWIKFGAQAGTTYTILTSGLGEAADTYLYLYDQDKVTLLASNDDYGSSLASQIKWTAPNSGTYYVLVRHWNPNVSGCGTTYSFSIQQEGGHLYLPLLSR